jgi:hypothetical protein
MFFTIQWLYFYMFMYMHIHVYRYTEVRVYSHKYRRLAETKGDFAEAAEMEDYESKKPKLARAYKAGYYS